MVWMIHEIGRKRGRERRKNNFYVTNNSRSIVIDRNRQCFIDWRKRGAKANLMIILIKENFRTGNCCLLSLFTSLRILYSCPKQFKHLWESSRIFFHSFLLFFFRIPTDFTGENQVWNTEWEHSKLNIFSFWFLENKIKRRLLQVLR